MEVRREGVEEAEEVVGEEEQLGDGEGVNG